MLMVMKNEVSCLSILKEGVVEMISTIDSVP
jgi:hypothetical protein